LNVHSWYRRNSVELILTLHAQPGARTTAFAGLHGGALKLRLAAPPVEGRANAELIRFLATAFGVPREQVLLRRGANSRRKTVHITRPTRVPPDLPPMS